ncbi:MAG: PBP1A family penicillin-binding protein [Chthoniobacterales bacterium]
MRHKHSQRKPAKGGRKRRSGWLTLLKFAFALLLIWGVIGGFYYAWALTFDLSKIGDMSERSVILDRDGKVYSRLAGENRVVVPFDKVSNYFVNALITREDNHFYYHHGVDPFGIARAIVRNLLFGGMRQGASTITQQLARNSFPSGIGNGKNFNRKLLEAAMAFRIESEMTKEQILECYMNRIYFGSGYYGIEAASQAYFGKPASRLNLSEAGLMAGLIRGPSRFSPFINLEASIKQRNVVLKRMVEMEFITKAQMEEALASPLTLAPNRSSAPQENWAVDAVVRDLEDIIPDDIQDGGLRIYTTIDPELQSAAERIVEATLQKIESRHGFPHPAKATFPAHTAFDSNTPYLQGALIAIDNHTGGIRAIVGGRDYSQSKFHRALFAHRQAGSSVKPFVYTLAFEKGMKPGDPISDATLQPGDLPAKYGKYQPSNSDGTFGGILPAEEGLIHSRNTMSIRVGMRAGIDNVADRIQRLALHKDPPRFPSLFLGSFETNLKDLTASYTAFANAGVKLQPYLVERVENSSGQILYKATHGKIAVLDPQAAAMTTSIMEKILDRGTGARSHEYGLRKIAAGKTGTTNRSYDAWFVGFISSLTCGVWVGMDQPQPIMHEGYASDLALPIWVDFIQSASPTRYPAENLH